MKVGEYDIKRLEVAIQYINRMVSGRNPVTNRPAPENEVLTNPNVNRCLQFVSEILADVKSTGGIVGKAPKVPRAARAPKPSIVETFPYEILQGFRFQRDQQISYFLKQLAELLPEDESLGFQATMITDWLRENGYLEKTFMKDISKETNIPTKKGEEIGIYSEKAGTFPNEYYRIFYNEKAQLFLISNFRRILTEGNVIRERLRKERREKKEQQRAEEKSGMSIPGQNTVPAAGRRPYGSQQKQNADGQSNRAPAAADYEDPAFLSLLNSVPADVSYGGAQEDYSYDNLQVFQIPEAPGSNQADGFEGFSEGGWESMDEGLPW